MPSTTLPLGTEVTYRGMTGAEEDLLMNDKKFRSGEAIDEILAGCVESITTGEGEDAKTKDFIQVGDIQRLKTPDRLALLLNIRRASYGDQQEVELGCTNKACGDTFNVVVDLSQIENVPAPEDYEADIGFEVVIGEGDDKKVIRFDYMTGHRERALAKQQSNLMTFAMLSRIKEVEGVHKNDVRKWLLGLPVLLRRDLRSKMSEVEAGPSMERTADCPVCGEEVAFHIHAQPGFFFPEG